MEASRIFSAVIRHFSERSFACLPEFMLKTGRRPDVVCLGRDGQILIIEVKSSVADFKSDQKWHEYCDWADAFYFAVDDQFPRDILPDETQCGIIITDGFDCHVTRPAPMRKLAGARRAHITRRLARVAMMRLTYQDDTSEIEEA